MSDITIEEINSIGFSEEFKKMVKINSILFKDVLKELEKK